MRGAGAEGEVPKPSVLGHYFEAKAMLGSGMGRHMVRDVSHPSTVVVGGAFLVHCGHGGLARFQRAERCTLCEPRKVFRRLTRVLRSFTPTE